MTIIIAWNFFFFYINHIYHLYSNQRSRQVNLRLLNFLDNAKSLCKLQKTIIIIGNLNVKVGKER